MKKPLLVVGFGMLWLALAGCGSQAKLTTMDSRDPHIYVIDINPPDAPCSTGRHTYQGMPAFCQGLQDETTNNHCAQGLRKQLFSAQGCDGTFTPY